MILKPYKTYQEISAGGVPVLIENGKPMFVVVEREVIKDISLPKGHQKSGETLRQTAMREVLEETGFDAKPMDYLGKFTYKIKDDVHKKITMVTVHWFFMIVKSGKLIKSNNEIKQIRLLPLNSDFSILTYDNHRLFIKKAKKLIGKYF